MMLKLNTNRLLLALLPILLLIFCSCSTATAQGNDQWVYLAQAKLPGLQQQLQQRYESGAAPLDAGRMRVLKIQQRGQSQPLYVVDTRVALEPKQRKLNPACGAAGCAIVAYISSQSIYQEVLSVYLDPIPPKRKALIEPTSKIQNGLPCLNFNQRQIKTGQVEVLQWCYNGQSYQFVSSSVQQP
ncbi:MAG: hypothetical protein MUC48_20830 [Leptolyngbya sp. Prado105]|jgi:hypothetical protein|nr:hypothetical protein [Leptolyngbya sp. Prado105]